MKRGTSEMSSLDMLLDTMCNTFGGVCFIALLVSIISVSLPPDRPDAESDAGGNDLQVANLLRQRNALAAAVDALEAQIGGQTNATPVADAAWFEQQIAETESKLGEVAAETAGKKGEASSIEADTASKNKDIGDLNAIIAALEKELDDPKYKRTRIVRVPHERFMADYTTRDLLLYKGRCYDLADKSQFFTTESPRSLTYTIRGNGVAMGGGFADEPFFRRLMDETASKVIVRIFTDQASAKELVALIGALASRRRPYNWRYNGGGSSITFVEGSDLYVQ